MKSGITLKKWKLQVDEKTNIIIIENKGGRVDFFRN